MAESAAHLVDEVFPKKPMRQWVLSFPFQLRFLFAKDPRVMGEILNLVNRVLSTFLIKKAGLTKKSGARTGSVTEKMIHMKMHKMAESFKQRLSRNDLTSQTGPV